MQIVISGKQNFMDNEVTVIEGGFGEDQRTVLVKEIAVLHNVQLKHINELINNNKHRFNNYDMVDLKNDTIAEEILITNGLYSSASVKKSNSIYLFSERGYMKLVSMLSNDNEKKWEVMDKFINEYFAMKKYIRENKEALLLKLFSKDPLEVVNAHKTLVELEVAEATKQLNKIIEVNQPKIEYYDKVLNAESKLTTTFIAKELGLTAKLLNATLKTLNIIYPQGKHWYLYKEYANQELATTKTILTESGDKVEHMICWTEKGREFIHDTFNRIRKK